MRHFLMDCVYIYAKFFYRHFSSLFICLIFFYSQRKFTKGYRQFDQLYQIRKFEVLPKMSYSRTQQNGSYIWQSKAYTFNRLYLHQRQILCPHGFFFITSFVACTNTIYIYIYILLFNIAKYSYF